MSAFDCSTCFYRDDCVDRCIGYLEDDEAASARADYEEACAEIERDLEEDRDDE